MRLLQLHSSYQMQPKAPSNEVLACSVAGALLRLHSADAIMSTPLTNSYLAASARFMPTIAGNTPVDPGSAFCDCGGVHAVASGKRVFISRRNPSSVSTLAASLA